MNIDELTIGDARRITAMLGGCDPSHPWKIGKKYLIRTVTHYYTGELVEVHGHEIVLEHASWIADTGRFHDSIKDGTASEVEPMGRVIVGRGAIVDATEWNHSLLEVQK